MVNSEGGVGLWQDVWNTDKFIYDFLLLTQFGRHRITYLRVASETIMVHNGVRSREATHVRRRKYRSQQTITSSLSVASRSVVNRKKQRLVKVGNFNARTDFRAFELQKLAADLKINILVIQEHRRSKSDVDFQGNLPKGWQILLGAHSAPGVGGIGFLLSSQCSPWLLDY